MAARSSLLRRPTPGARPARRTSSVVAALAALAPRLVRLAHHDYSDGLLARAELRRALPQGAALLLRLAARLPGRGRLPRLHRLLLPLRSRLLHHLRFRPEHHGELLADPLHRHPPGADLRHPAAHHAPRRRGAAARHARAPPHLSAGRPRHRGREAGRLPGRDRGAPPGTLVYPAWVYHVQPFPLEPL